MADTTTSIVDWRTVTADNLPIDSHSINSSSAGRYTSLADAFRDVKGVIRAESTNLAWDPSASISNINATNAGTRFISMSSGEKITVKLQFGKWMRGVEGQQFVLTIRSNAASTTASPTYTYYTGYVASARNQYTGSNLPNLCDIYITGLRKWATESSGSDSTGLTVSSVNTVDSGDVDKVGTSSEDPTTGGRTTDVSLDFSAYPPMQNLGYAGALFRTDLTVTLGWGPGVISDESNPQFLEQSAVPRKTQCGKIRMVGAEKTTCAIFPYPEVNENYSLTVTPITGTDNASSAPVGAFIVESIKKSKSFVSITFQSAAGTGTDYIDYDWEITRNY